MQHQWSWKLTAFAVPHESQGIVASLPNQSDQSGLPGVLHRLELANPRQPAQLPHGGRASGEKLQALPGQNVKRMCRHSVPSSGSSTRLRTLCKCNLQAWYSGWLVMGLPYNVSHSKLPGVAAHSTSCHLARRFLCRSRLLMLNILWKASWVRNVYRVWYHRYLIKLQYVSREIRKMRIDHRCSNASKHDMILTISCHIDTVWYNDSLLFFAFVCPFPFPDSSAKVQVLATQRDLTQKTTNWLSEADESLGGCEWLGS